LLDQLVATASSIALLVDAAMPVLAEPTTKTVQAASRTLGVRLRGLKRCATRAWAELRFWLASQIKDVVERGSSSMEKPAGRLESIKLRRATNVDFLATVSARLFQSAAFGPVACAADLLQRIWPRRQWRHNTVA
jgi:hypothetical protein